MQLPSEILGEIFTFDPSSTNVELLDLSGEDLLEVLGRYGDPRKILGEKIQEILLERKYRPFVRELFDLIGFNFSIEVYPDQLVFHARDIRDENKTLQVEELLGIYIVDDFSMYQNKIGISVELYIPVENSRAIARILLELQSS